MKALADPRIAKFGQLVSDGIDAWTRAGRLLCEITAGNPHAHAEILAGNPHLSVEVLQSFERIGRRELHPYLAMDASAASRRLAMLPYDDQARLYREKVCVVVNSSEGPVERQKRVCDLTKAEAGRVIGEKGIRSVTEQRHLLRRWEHSTSPRGSSGPREEKIPAPNEFETTADLDADPKTELSRLLRIANHVLLEARSSLTMLKRRESKQDRHITAALQAIGHLRLAVNENDL
jgi:hypothetical protein